LFALEGEFSSKFSHSMADSFMLSEFTAELLRQRVGYVIGSYLMDGVPCG